MQFTKTRKSKIKVMSSERFLRILAYRIPFRLKTDYPDLHKNPMYMFGDFNFRLNTKDVIEVCGEIT